MKNALFGHAGTGVLSLTLCDTNHIFGTYCVTCFTRDLQRAETLIDIALLEPEIPPNTGNIIRLCANTGAQLHLIHPLGFELDDKRMRRAGLDYHEWANVRQHDSLEQLLGEVPIRRVLGMTTKGSVAHTAVAYQEGDLLLFGPESRGLPASILDSLPESQRVRVPMR